MADREKMVRGLVAMAAADGRIGKRERLLIEKLCRRWDVATAVLDEALEEAESGKRRLTVPKEKQERQELLRALVRVAAVDGVIDDGEQKMLDAFADRVGVSSFELRQMVEDTLQKREDRKRAHEAGLAASAEPTVAAPPPLPAASPPPPPLPTSSPPPAPSSPPAVARREANLDGPAAVSVQLGHSEHDVFGEPPWRSGGVATRVCGFCREVVPAQASVCPYCEVSFGSGLTFLSDARVKVGLVVAVFVLAVVAPYLAGRRSGQEIREDAEAAAAVIATPSPAEVARAASKNALALKQLQTKLKQAQAERARYRKRLDGYQDVDKALARRRNRKQLVQAAIQRREAEFRRLFPRAGRGR